MVVHPVFETRKKWQQTESIRYGTENNREVGPHFKMVPIAPAMTLHKLFYLSGDMQTDEFHLIINSHESQSCHTN